MKALIKSIARKSAYVTAVVIIIIAILVCVSRILTPVLDQHRGDFEKWASQLLQKPVSIKSVRVSWFQYQPEISLNQVTVLDQQTNKPLLQADKVSVFFSIPKSIWQRELVPSGIMISGSDINVRQNAAGEYSLQGFPALGGFNNQPFSSESRFADIMAWLTLQPKLILNDIDVRYTGINGQKRFFSLYNLSLTNTKSSHSIYGKAELHQNIPTQVSLAVQWQGKNVDLKQIDVKAYVYVSGLSLTQWLNGVSWHGWQVKQGVGSAKIWLSWNHGALQKIQSSYQGYDFQLYSATDKSIHKINRLSGNIGWKREANTQVFAGDDILIDLPSHLWPVTSFNAQLAPDEQGSLVPKTADIGYVDLKDVQTILFSSSPDLLKLIPDSLQQMLTGINLRGDLQSASITFASPWTDWNHVSLNASFNKISFSQWKWLPGVSSLSGDIKWRGTEGSLALKSTQSKIAYASLFPSGVELEQLAGTLQIQRDADNSWLLSLPALEILSPDIGANVSGTITIPGSGSPVVDLASNFSIHQVKHISRYLPTGLFDPQLATWLNQAFLSGELNSGHAELRGKLSDFPYDKGDGSFLIYGIVNNVDLHYAPEWPDLTHVNGKLEFSGRKMTVDLENAQILNIPLARVQGVIPYFGDAQPQILQVQSGDIQTDFEQALKLVHTSPLEKSIGKMFAGVDLSGMITMRLGLIVPIKNPDATKVIGSIQMNNADMNMVPWKIDLSHINGQLGFTESTVSAEKIEAQLFNKSFSFSLATMQQSRQISVIRATLASSLDMRDLEQWLKIPFTQYAQGETDVTGNIDFSSQTPIEIHLQSGLAGVALNLPDNFGKRADESRSTSLDITMPEKEPLKLKIAYGKILGAAVVLDRKDDTFNLVAADFRLGSGTPAWPAGPGLYITGNLDKLNWAQIRDYASQAGINGGSAAQLRSIDVSVASLDFMGVLINNARLQVTPAKKNWQIVLNSPDIAGQILVPQTITRQSLITAQFQKMNLPALTNNNNGSSAIDVKQLPSISIQANNVSYNNMPLGQVSLKTGPSSSGINIQSLHILSRLMDLQASGDWSQSRNYVTHLNGKAVSSRASELLNSFGFDVHNFVSSNAVLDFNLMWAGAPYAPSISSMSGKVYLGLGAGRIVDIGSGANAKVGLGQLLSIFSLQTIPRRLMFDFSDVFQKGYNFDSLKGNFELRNGNAYTSNFLFDGNVAKVGINGRIGLKDKDFNFTLIVIPSVTSVTSSIPIAATLITMNPLVGLGAFAVNTVLGPQFSKATTYYYDVTGPWSNPVWKSVKVYKAK